MSQEYTYDSEPGLEIPISAPAHRLVSLVPSITESLFDLNLGERIVGITDFCTRPEAQVAQLTRVGGTKTPDIACIIDLKPDLVFANQEENRKEDVETLQAAGIPVWVTYPKTVQDVFNLLWNIMYVFEETSMVPRVRLMEQTHNWVFSISEERDNQGVKCKVFVPIWHHPLMTIGSDTYAHDLLQVCGGSNVFGSLQAGSRYPQVTLDDVVAAQPDVILLPSEPFHFTEKHVAEFAALDVPAAKNGHIHLVDGALLFWHGTRIAFAFNEIPPLLCPEEADVE